MLFIANFPCGSALHRVYMVWIKQLALRFEAERGPVWRTVPCSRDGFRGLDSVIDRGVIPYVYPGEA